MIIPPIGMSKHVHPLEHDIIIANKVACAECTAICYHHSSSVEVILIISLLPGHTCQLMQSAVGGPCVPDLRDTKEEELAAVFNEFLEKAYRMCWSNHVEDCSNTLV